MFIYDEDPLHIMTITSYLNCNNILRMLCNKAELIFLSNMLGDNNRKEIQYIIEEINTSIKNAFLLCEGEFNNVFMF